MGLSDQQELLGNAASIFCNDVLRLEVSGPAEEHLSVIDVPGIFKNTTSGLTTKSDITLVRQMVQGYMDNPRSVMLTVIPANVDIATQEILELAADADPEGHMIVHDIHDILCSYYKVARKRFADNVCMQAVDHFLIHGPETPLALFSPSLVSSLTADELERIAGEDNLTKRRRHHLKKEIESLEAGKKILLRTEKTPI